MILIKIQGHKNSLFLFSIFVSFDFQKISVLTLVLLNLSSDDETLRIFYSFDVVSKNCLRSESRPFFNTRRKLNINTYNI